MRTVVDDEGRRYLLLKESADASLVRAFDTGERSHKPNETLRHLEDDPLRVAGRSAPPTLLERVPDERTAGLFVLLDGEGTTSVRSLLARTELCESDLYGMLRELEAADLVERHETREDATYTAAGDQPGSVPDVDQS